MPGWELLDDEGRPLTLAAPADRDPLDRDPPTLPWWLDPRKASGRTVLYCLFVIAGAWILSARQQTPVDTGPGTAAPAAIPRTTTTAAAAVPEVIRIAAFDRLSGPARTAARLLTPSDRGPSPATLAPGQARAAAVLRRHLRHFRIVPAPADLRRSAGRCALVLRAEQGSDSVALSVVAGAHRVRHPTTQWQALAGPDYTFEWVQHVDATGRTILVAAYGQAGVPGLDPLIRLATDPRLAG